MITIYFLLTNIKSGLLVRIRKSVCISKISENFFRLIFLDGFLFERIRFVSMIKFAQFPVNNLSHSGVSSPVLLLCRFAVFAYHVFNRFISFFTVLLRIINFCFNIIVPYCVVFCCYQERFSFSLEVSLCLAM